MRPTIPVVDELRKFGMMPLPDRLRMSGLAEIAGYDTVPRGAPLSRLRRRLHRTVSRSYEEVPGGRGRPRPFCCLRPVTPHGPPILGRSRFANLFYNVGQGHLGWTLAHGSAKIVAALLAGRDPGLDLKGLLPTSTQ